MTLPVRVSMELLHVIVVKANEIQVCRKSCCTVERIDSVRIRGRKLSVLCEKGSAQIVMLIVRIWD